MTEVTQYINNNLKTEKHIKANGNAHQEQSTLGKKPQKKTIVH